MAKILGVEDTYQSHLFVNRSQQINQIANKVKTIQGEGIAESFIVNTWGVRGIGKSWLLSHLHQTYRINAVNAPVDDIFRPTFSLFWQFEKQIVDTIHYDSILSSFLEQIGNQLQNVFEPNELDAWQTALDNLTPINFIALLNLLSLRFVPVILLDQTEYVFAAWAEWERTFIEPLIVTNRILFVIAGRRPIPEWTRFEVRRRVASLDLSRLNGFSKIAIQEQVNRLSGQIVDADELYKWSATSPLIAKALLKEGERKIGKLPWTAAAWSQHRSDMLPPVYEEAVEYLFKDIPPQLVNVLQAISALRFYRLDGVRHMLKLQGETERPYSYYLKLTRKLVQETEYVWWNRDRRAYITSRVVRSLLNQQQILIAPDLFVRQHQKAVEMYQEWVDKYPEASEDFILEIWFHWASIFSLNGEKETLENQLRMSLNVALENLSFDRANTLFNQFKTDEELRDLLPEPLFLALSRQLADALAEGKEIPAEQ